MAKVCRIFCAKKDNLCDAERDNAAGRPRAKQAKMLHSGMQSREKEKGKFVEGKVKKAGNIRNSIDFYNYLYTFLFLNDFRSLWKDLLPNEIYC